MKALRYFWVGLLLIGSCFAGTIDSFRKPASGWQGYVGIPGGIPDTSGWTVINVTQAPYNADNTGATDASTAIQSAITAAVAAGSPRVIYLPTGTYKLNSGVQAVGINNFDNVQHPFSVLIKGDGPSLTRINYYGASGSVIGFVPANGYNARTMTIASGNTRGSTSIVVGSVDSYMATGIPMVIRRVNSEAITSHPLFPSEQGGGYQSYTCSQVVKITNISGSTVTFTPALNEGYASDSVAIGISMPYHSGVEGIYIDNKVDHTGCSIYLELGLECWVKNVESNKVGSNNGCWHVQFVTSLFHEARNNVIHDTYGGASGSGYGIGNFQFCSNGLFENNIAYNLRHSFPHEYGGQGNVVGYNYSFNPLNDSQSSTDYLMGDDLGHGGEGRYNLYEGNVIATIREDMVLGGNGPWTQFRNQVQRKAWPATYLGCFGSDIQGANYYNNLTGNVYEAPPVASSSGLRRWGTDGDIPSGAVTEATNATPIVIAYTGYFYVPTGQTVVISGVTGNTAANGTFTATYVDATHFSLQGTTGNGAYVSGGSFNDPQSQSTAFVDGEYDIVTNTTTWAGADHTLPNSYYLASQPSWWTSLPWPSIGPDLANKFGTNPAYQRYWANNGGLSLGGSLTIGGNASIK